MKIFDLRCNGCNSFWSEIVFRNGGMEIKIDKESKYQPFYACECGSVSFRKLPAATETTFKDSDTRSFKGRR